MRSKQTKFQSERIAGEVCLGAAVAAVETLVVWALIIAFT
jgi:hypothetical protein